MRFFKGLAIAVFLMAVVFSNTCQAGVLSSKIKLDIKEFRIENGMQFLVVERHATPQVACRIAIRAGSALEDTGSTGIAHMLEHMMFKGTKNFGTLDVKKDQELQAGIERAYQAVLKEEKKRKPDKGLIRSRLDEMSRLRLEVQKIYIPKAFSAQLGRNGAVNVNAFTTKDQTQFTASVPSDMIEQWFSMISEQLFEPSWREFYVEKEVVRREWAYRYVNNPQGAARLDLNATAYTAHPYHNPTIGWKSDMEKYNTAEAIKFHKKYYNPTNAVCVLVGDVTLKQAKKLAKTYFQRYPRGERASEAVTAEPLQQGPRESIRFLKGALTPVVRIGFHTAKMRTKDFYALDAMTMVLSCGRGARITRNIINKGLAVQAWAYNPDNRYAGMVIFGGSPNEPDILKKKNIAGQEKKEAYINACRELEKNLLAEVEKLKAAPVSVRELNRIRKLNQRGFLDRMRSNEELAGSLATMEVQTGWEYLSTYISKINEVTPDDIMRVAKKYFKTDNKTSVYVIPGGMPDHPPEHYSEIRSVNTSSLTRLSRSFDFVNYSDYPRPKDWKHPLSFERKPFKIKYPQAERSDFEGAAIFFLPDRELPIIDLTILVKAGAVDVGLDKTGLTSLLNKCLIRGGTEKYSSQEFAMLLDDNAIQLSFAARGEETVIKLSVMNDDWERALDLLIELITHPEFDAGVLKAVKQQEMVSLKRQAGDALTVAMREGTIRHFKGHRYGRDPLLGLKTIPDITRDDLKAFIKKYFVPSNMVMGIAGDINKARAMEGIAKLMNALPKVEAPERKLDEPVVTPPVLALINKPGQVQSQVVFFLPGLLRTDPDYFKMNLLMEIFGGSDSLVYTRLRDDLGIIYTSRFYQTCKWKAGILAGYIGCQGDKTGQAINETVKIMNSLRKDVPKEELEQKRLDVLNSFVFNVDTPSDLVAVYAHYYMRGEPLDTLDRIQDAFIGVKKEELETLAKRYLDPERLQVFVVGDKNTMVNKKDGTRVTLERNLKVISRRLGLPFEEIVLR